MFTGLVETTGTIAHVEAVGESLRAAIEHDLGHEPVAPGESIAVDGCCLTAVDPQPGRFEVDISRESVDRTGGPNRWRSGRRVNLERAMRVGDRFGGHIVQGHVDDVAKVVSLLRRDDGSATLQVQVPPAGMRYLVHKGSVTLDGVSLTVARIAEDTIEIWLIPTTLAETTLGEVAAGDPMNLEYDVLAKYVEKAVAAQAPAKRQHS